MNITPHFSLEGMTFSRTAIRLGLDNSAPADVLVNLKKLCETLEKFRAIIGLPINVSSGYRCLKLNTAIGSDPTSAHVKGLAVDINVEGITPKALGIIYRQSGLDFDQLIQEGTWLHIGLSNGIMRRQMLTAHFVEGKKPTYTEGF